MTEVIIATKRVYELEETPFKLKQGKLMFYFSSNLRLKIFKRDFPKRLRSLLYRLQAYTTEDFITFNYDLIEENVAIKTYLNTEKKGSRYEYIQ